MKANKGLILAIAAGTVIAGLATFFFATEKGKKLTRKWKVPEKADELMKKAKGWAVSGREIPLREKEMEKIIEPAFQ